jgi:hypothetical protein
MAGKRLAVFVTVDGTQYGPDDDVPADVAEKIENPDVWADEEEDEAPAKSSRSRSSRASSKSGDEK